MEVDSNLAIVIPAYKKSFLEEALLSIAGQTCKKFTLYIGDDASPHDLYPLVKPFEKSVKLIYKRFDENLGHKDLVAHWERCIDMTQGEDWIWLFSDDDVMESRCVESFYSILEKEKYDLYHFNVIIVDKDSVVKRVCTEYPPLLTAVSFFGKTVSHTLESYVTEYIFNRRHFLDCGRFQHFDFAWGSDHATWTKLSFRKGILTIPESKVRWRSSGENISSAVGSPKIIARQVKAGVSFYFWGKSFFQEKNVDMGLDDYDLLKSFIDRNAHFFPFLSSGFIREQIKKLVGNNRPLFNEKYQQAMRIKKNAKKEKRKQFIRKVRAVKRTVLRFLRLRS